MGGTEVEGMAGRHSSVDALHALDSAKRRAYSIGLGIAIPMDLVGLLMLVGPAVEVVATQLATVGLYVVLLVLLVRRRLALHTFECVAYVGVAFAYVARVATVMSTVDDVGAVAIGLIGSSTGAIILYIMAFVSFDKARARILAVVMSGVTTLVMGISVRGRPTEVVQGLILLAPWLLGLHAIIIVLLYVLAAAKEKMAFSLAMAEAMSTAAATDSLTGVANRRGLSAVVTDLIEQRRRYGTPLSLVLVDLDHFKRVNDSFGHAAGDEVLREVCTRLQGELRTTDTLGRWGGEEFLVLAPSTEGCEAVQLAERCGEALRAGPIGEVGTVTASFGVATHAGDETVDQLLSRADEALYEAKRQGRSRVAVAPLVDDLLR